MEKLMTAYMYRIPSEPNLKNLLITEKEIEA